VGVARIVSTNILSRKFVDQASDQLNIPLFFQFLIPIVAEVEIEDCVHVLSSLAESITLTIIQYLVPRVTLSTDPLFVFITQSSIV